MTELTDFQFVTRLIIPGAVILGVIWFFVVKFRDINRRLNFLQDEVNHTAMYSSSNTIKASLEVTKGGRIDNRAEELAREIASILDTPCSCGDGWICVSCQITEAAYYAIAQAYEEGLTIGRSEVPSQAFTSELSGRITT